MKNIFGVVLLLIFAVVAGSELVDYRLRNFPILPRAACSQPGLFCSDCSTLSMCVANSAGGFEDIFVDTCASGETCLDGECIKTPNPNCSPTATAKFLCVTSGLFPNPGDCKKYHYCVPRDTGIEEVEVPCAGTGNYGYNPKSTYCDKPLTNSLCNGYPVPICPEAGYKAPLKENPTIYYVCLQNGNVLYPVQQACENGKIYTTANGCR